MWSQFRSWFAKTWGHAKTTPRAVKKVYVEAQEARRIRSLPCSCNNLLKCRTRQQHELVRSSTADVRKFAAFFIIQFPPVIGYIPVFIALTFPKYLLTQQFWTRTERSQFRLEEHHQRAEAAKHLSLAEIKEWIGGVLEGTRSVYGRKSSIVSLACSHGILHYEAIHTPRMYSYFPATYLLTKLRRRAVEIVEDDAFFLYSQPEKVMLGEPSGASHGNNKQPDCNSSQAVLNESEMVLDHKFELRQWVKKLREECKEFDLGKAIDNVNMLSICELEYALVRRGVYSWAMSKSEMSLNAAGTSIASTGATHLSLKESLLWWLVKSKQSAQKHAEQTSLDSLRSNTDLLVWTLLAPFEEPSPVFR